MLQLFLLFLTLNCLGLNYVSVKATSHISDKNLPFFGNQEVGDSAEYWVDKRSGFAGKLENVPDFGIRIEITWQMGL